MKRPRFLSATARECFIPLLLGFIAFVVIGALGVPNFPGFQTFAALEGSTTKFALLALALAVYNGVLFWRHTEPHFLTWGTARCFFAGWYLFLVLILPVLWGAVLVLRGDAVLAVLTGLPVDFALTAKCAYVGEAVLAAALALSSLWKRDEPGLSSVRLARRNAVNLLQGLAEGQPLNHEEKRQLEGALAVVRAKADELRGVLNIRDSRLLHHWASAAQELDEQIRPRDALDLPGQARSIIINALSTLRVERSTSAEVPK